ncbi:MAG: hypothetical protein LBJ18_02015 [Rickettsiales bacterium]|jgi:choline dehydrogenase-like flavoprotein|nr:hypothetical protein [Rickettsiales bacterium]
MKKIIMFAVVAAVAGTAFAEPSTSGHKGNKGGGYMGQLTEEQVACIEAQNCPRIKIPQSAGNQKSEKGQMPKMTEEQKAEMDANRECMKKAMKTCGIQIPERAKDKDGEKPKDKKDK